MSLSERQTLCDSLGAKIDKYRSVSEREREKFVENQEVTEVETKGSPG
jgi:hypothetical protein